MFTHELKRQRSPVPYILAITTVIAVAVVALVPVPRQVKSTFVLQPSASTELKATRGGVVASVVPEGHHVEKGAPVVTYDPAPNEAKLKELEAAVKADEAKLKAAGAPNKNLPKLKDALAKAEAAEAQAKAAVEKAKPGPAKAAAEKKLEAAAAATKKARDAVGPTADELKAGLATLQQQLADVKAELAAPALVAPQAGTLAGVAVKPGQELAAGAVVARLDDTDTLKVVIPVPKGETLKAGQAVDLTVDANRKRVQLEAVAGETATALLPNATHELKPGADGVAEITMEPRSMLGGLLAK